MDERTHEIWRSLIDALYSVYDNDEFVDGVYSALETESDAQIVIEYINRGEEIDPTQIGLLALTLSNAHEEEKKRGNQ